MFQPYKEDGRYPDQITFAWQRSDSDWEILGTLNGTTIEDTATWNHLVEQTLSILQYHDSDTLAYEREDVTSVLVTPEDEEWIPIDVQDLHHE